MRANLSNACQSEAEEVQNEVIQMTTYAGKELANAFRTVRKNTIQVAEDIIAVAVRFWDDLQRKQRRTTMQGIDFFAIAERADAEESKPRSKAEIAELHRT
jgi:hypothetical protein